MNDEIEIYTLTMARIYAEQGHFGKAAAICRHLLQKDPGNSVLQQALEMIERQQIPTGPVPKKDLTSLFKEWVDLVQKYKNFNKLKKLKTRL
jgi:hypothetical protein